YSLKSETGNGGREPASDRAVFRELHDQKTHGVRISAAGRPWLNQSFIAISASFVMVFMLRAVPNLAAGIFSLERPMPLPQWTYISRTPIRISSSFAPVACSNASGGGDSSRKIA